MPHFGQLKAVLGTLRRDGDVRRVQNSLTTDTEVDYEFEDATSIEWEDGTEMET